MPPKQYVNAPTKELSAYITPDVFRTVMHEQYEQPCGLSEVPVELELNEPFAASLSFTVPWDKWLYGFVRCGGELLELREKSQVKKISLHDWDKKFLLVIETDNGDLPFFVSKDEVHELLEGCLRPPEQR